jgi:Fe(3+) dicitrate transport protein
LTYGGKIHIVIENEMHFQFYCPEELMKAVLSLILFAVPLYAQQMSSTVKGRVVDGNSAAVSNAKVFISCRNQIEKETRTDATGGFQIEKLPEDTCTITVTRTGFSTASHEMAVRGETVRIPDITLLPGELSEQLQITSNRISLESAEERIPGSIEIIDSRTLEISRVFTTSEALRKVAGVNVRDEEGFGLRPNIGIRGVNPTRSSKVLLLEDGIPLTFAPYGDNASYYHPPIDRFDSIEVLKGSGQILYGPTTVAGVINYITPAPPERSAGSVKLVGGNRDYFNGSLNWGTTWRGTGFLFDYTRKQGRGARDNNRFGLNDFNFKSVTSLTNKQALTLRGNYYGEDSKVSYSGLTEAEYRVNPRQNPFLNDRFYGDRFGASATHAYVFNPNVNLTTNLYTSYFKRHWWRQSSNSNERPNDATCGGLANLNSTCGNQGRLRKYQNYGIDPRLNLRYSFLGFSNETDLGARAHFEVQDRRQLNGRTPDARNGLLVEDNERRNQAYSAFIQNRFVRGDLAIIPGVRVERVFFDRVNRLNGRMGSTHLTEIIPGIGIVYSPASKLTFFGGLHRGFAPPRTEDIISNTGGTIDLDPELSWNIEAGLRSRPLSGVTLDATVFRMDYENQLIPQSVAQGTSVLTNGGETLHQGFEFTGQVSSRELFGFAHNFYLRSAYTYLPYAKFTGRRFSNLSVIDLTGRRVTYNELITGNRLPYAPEHLLTSAVGYSHPRGLDAFLESVYVSRQLTNNLNRPIPARNGQTDLIPSYTIWNGALNYHMESLRSTLFVTVKNIFDKTYIVDRTRGILPGAPRLVQAGVKVNF